MRYTARWWPGKVMPGGRLSCMAVFVKMMCLRRACAVRRPPTHVRLFSSPDAEVRDRSNCQSAAASSRARWIDYSKLTV
jgi:hypothetical protein